VSIHDVSPAWKREVEDALEVAHAHGVRPALLVVPNFHGRAPLDGDPEFCARLRELQAEGHEIYLHGFYHRAEGDNEDGAATGSRLRWFFRQKIVSAGEAEFAAVSPREAERRLDDGRKMLDNVGLSPSGFVAPAWSMPSWLLPMLGARGYGFAEDHLRVYDPAAGARASSSTGRAGRPLASRRPSRGAASRSTRAPSSRRVSRFTRRTCAS
jgi:predicted deacetylase